MPKTANKSEAPSRAVSQFLSVEEAAELLKISQVSIRRYLGQKKLKKFKVGSRTLLERENVMSLVREA